MPKKITLGINAHLKFIEFVLKTIAEAHNNKTVGEIREEYQREFNYEMPSLLDQNFGLIRLIPLIHIAEDGCIANEEDKKTIKAIRNAFTHNTVSYDNEGYTFAPQPKHNHKNVETVRIKYADFLTFLNRIENNFYQNADNL